MTFEEWFGAQLPRLVRFTTVLCGGPDPAEEVLQEVALKAHRRWERLRDLDHPEAYLRAHDRQRAPVLAPEVGPTDPSGRAARA
jgi:DNA-directed RNA polymerase specialized sigma24 family protein